MRLTIRNCFFILVFLLSAVLGFAQISEPFSAIPSERRDALWKRLGGYVDAYQNRKWEKLYGFISEAGKGGVDLQRFVAAMSSNHGKDFAQYPDLQAFSPYRTRKNGDGYDIYGCARAVREGEPFQGIAEVHTIFEHEDWFFSGWTFHNLSEGACKELSNPTWQPDRPVNWDKPMEDRPAH
jgi:hypothetical protein